MISTGRLQCHFPSEGSQYGLAWPTNTDNFKTFPVEVCAASLTRPGRRCRVAPWMLAVCLSLPESASQRVVSAVMPLWALPCSVGPPRNLCGSSGLKPSVVRGRALQLPHQMIREHDHFQSYVWLVFELIVVRWWIRDSRHGAREQFHVAPLLSVVTRRSQRAQCQGG